MTEPVLSVRGLKTYFDLPGGIVRAVDGVDLDLYPGRITAIVGGSGSGKSVTSLSLLRLIEPPGRIVAGSALFEGRDLFALPERKMRAVRGRRIAMIFQDPAAALDPVMTVRRHLDEACGGRQPTEVYVEMLRRVGLREAHRVLESYSFELSGGMCQRVMIAMGLLAGAEVLLADEPTSALDLTTQRAILDELLKCRDAGVAVALITHDLGVAAQTADDVCVMHSGRIVERGSVFDVFDRPRHEYTRTLMASIM